MMHLMEPFFDLAYLGMALGMGLRLLMEDEKDAKSFGLMAVLLGLGDGFHLIPRVMSHLSPNGFSRYLALLSWGEFVTGITMTLFYLLFYRYYQSMSGDRDKRKTRLVYVLVVLRLLLVLLPQNGWGTEGNYVFGLLRNVPFVLLGLVLALWTAKAKNKPGLEHTSLLIAASFLFYIPVVIGVRFVPLLGLLMIPKTIAYVLLVRVGYRHFVSSNKPLALLKQAITFLVLGLCGGVFYREFTKAFGWMARTTLSVVHVHLLVLGFLVFLLLFISLQTESYLDTFRCPLALYRTGLTWTVAAFMIRGIYTITSEGNVLFPDAMLSGMAGIGHILLGVGIVWTMFCVLQAKKGKEV
ncbi:DUF2871 family protein [uncultured Murdochiella sp.]|uniref:DUF2871 family protein n=1 Tax=uncultured Murdochiella sp. TaxID=1586095 RepID=UPI00280551FF|nr:DUF2871 family protein [uncultured Murdochiella sp.]